MRVVPSFLINLDKREIPLVYRIKEFFGGAGSIRESGTSVVYSVSRGSAPRFPCSVLIFIRTRKTSIQEINKVIIPHFDKYQLLTQKGADFLLFKMIMGLINEGAHLTTEGLAKIISYQGAMNKGISQNLRISFPPSLP
jgi:hypothetical protein